MKKQRWISLLGALFICITTPVGVRAQTESQGETVRFQDYPGLGNLMIRVARTKGYCKAAGINCEMTMIPAAPLGLQALIGGSLDVAQTPIEVLAAAVSRGSKLRAVVGSAVSNIFQVDVIATLPLPNETKGFPAMMQDLKGRKIGVSARGAATEVFFRALLQDAGLEADDVTFVAVGAPNTAFAAMRAGSVDAIVSWEPAGTMCELTKVCKLVYRGASAARPAIFKAMYGAGTALVMRAEDIEKRPHIARAVRDVSRQAEKFVNDPANQAEVLQISSGYFKFDMPQGDIIARRTLEISLESATFRTMVKRDAVAATLDYLKQTNQLVKLPSVKDLVWDAAPAE